jgi:hypothetical protein
MRRVSAPPLERAIASALRDVIGSPLAAWDELRPFLGSATIHPDRVALLLHPTIQNKSAMPLPAAGEDGLIRRDIPIRLQTRGGRTWIENADAPARRRLDRALIAGLRRGHQILAEAGIQPAGQTPLWRDAKAVADPYLQRLASLAFLAPDIQQAILDGRQPVGLTLKNLRERDIPVAWADQRIELGFKQALIIANTGPDPRGNRP